MLQQDNCGLVVVDIQGKLASMVLDNGYIEQTRKLIQACQMLSMPIIWLEQYPKGLGHTISEIAELLEGIEHFEKLSFGGMQDPTIKKAIQATGRKQWLVCGIETHICVYQTVRGLLADKMTVEVVTDCVSSRSQANLDLGLAKTAALGAGHTSFEMAVYELMKGSDNPQFKSILPLMKD